MASVFGHLIFQLFVTFQGTKNKVPESQRFLYWGASVVLSLILFLTRFPLPVKVMLFSAMAYISGMVMNDVKDVREAIIETATIFASMFVAGVRARGGPRAGLDGSEHAWQKTSRQDVCTPSAVPYC